MDQRFVGKWDAGLGVTWHLDPDGRLRISGNVGTMEGKQRWWISKERLVIYTPSPYTLTNAHRWMSYISRRIVGKPVFSLGFDDYPITSFDGDTMQLNYKLDLKRVPELAKP